MSPLTYVSPPHVTKSSGRGLRTFLFVFALLYAIWFTVVLYGEQAGWTANPGAWAYLPTKSWAWVGILLYALASLYFVILLVRREVPAKTYTVGAQDAPGTPSFLAPAEAAPPAEETATPPPGPPQP